MTNWGFEENQNSEGLGNSSELNGPKALRDYAASLKAQNDALNEKLTSFLEEQQKEKMSKVFESLGVPGAQAAYQGPADPEKAKAWVESMQSLFGNAPAGTPAAVEAPVEPTLPASMQAQFQRMTEAGQLGTPLGNVEAAQGAVDSASSSQEIIAAFERMQRM